jgi:DNA-binding response OmpR family regulator
MIDHPIPLSSQAPNLLGLGIMPPSGKKILIIDEEGFSRICSALLEKEGYRTETLKHVHELDPKVNFDNFGLIIMSYPYSSLFHEEIKGRRIPTIILSDHITKDLISTLAGFDSSHSYCMIKPLDYGKFRTLITHLMRDELSACEEYNII